MGGVKETPMDISVLGPEIQRGKESGNQGKNKVKKFQGKQSHSWVSAGLSGNGPGLEKACPECGAIPELEMMLLVQLSVHPHKQLCCIFSGMQFQVEVYLSRV